jgi:hypothetical protein
MMKWLFAFPVVALGRFNNSKCPLPHELQAEGLADRFDLHNNYPGHYYELAFHDILQWVCPTVTCVDTNKTVRKYSDGQEYVNEAWGLECFGKDYPQVLENNVTDIPGHFTAFVPVTKMPFLPKGLLKKVLFPNTVVDFRPGDQGWTVEFQCVELPHLGVVYTGINYYSKNTTEEAFQDMDAAAKKAGIDYYFTQFGPTIRRVPQDNCNRAAPVLV